MKTTIAIAVFVVCAGCVSEPKIESTKLWEGHYFTVQEFNDKTKDISLDKNESIWVLSNNTLNRLLKNTRK